MIQRPLEPITAFESHSRTRIVFGPQAVERVGELALELGTQRILLVTDQGIMDAGHGSRVEGILRKSGLHVTMFTNVRENPTTRCIDECLALAQAEKVDTIVGLGGGSSMDTAKGCNFLLTNGGQMQDYWGVGKATKPMLPLIAVPTTAGTGSECQSAALITDETTHQKMACLDPKAAARIAVLDPLLTLSQPPSVTAVTGIDAIAHAVETAVCTKRNPLSLMYSHQAFKLLSTGFPRVLSHPDDLNARAYTQWGAALSGLAIEHSMLGAAHSAANPLTAHFQIIHGQAVGLMLPGIVRFNGQDAETARAYMDLAVAANLARLDDDPAVVVENLAATVEQFRELARLPGSLTDCGIKSDQLSELADEAARQWTANFNPRAIGAADFAAIYNQAL